MKWMKQHMSFFEMEEASADTMNDGTSKICRIEEAPTDAESLNADDHSKLLKLPFPKIAMTRKRIISTFMEQMTLLDQIYTRSLKEYPENKEDCCTHVCKHFNSLMRIPYKPSNLKKKAN